MVSDQQSIPNFRRHPLELHSRTLLEPSPSNIEKDKYYAVDYGKNYYTGRTRSAPDERQFTLLKFLHKLQRTDITRFDWSRHSTCILGPVELKGTGPCEVLDPQELEADFQSVS